MNAELVFFGKRLDMARRQRRRVLVIVIYAALAVLLASLWRLTQWHGSAAWEFWAILLVCRFFLGGYYTGGLVKPFNNRGPYRTDEAPPLLMLKLRIYQPLPANSEPYRNDERELRQRDHAHYAAYQVLGGALAVLWLLASIRNDIPKLFNWIAMPPDELFCGLITIALTLFLTLPQAILLWTEPDMD
jgi:energy-coupling factor transporter transmembrane protein EcfT